MEKEQWVTTEHGVYSKIEDIDPPEHYTSEDGRRYLLTKKKTINGHHMYGHQICDVCDSRVGFESITYKGHGVCSVECLNKLIERMNW